MKHLIFNTTTKGDFGTPDFWFPACYNHKIQDMETTILKKKKKEIHILNLAQKLM